MLFSFVAYVTIWILAANEARFSTRTLVSIETITVILILIVTITIFAKLIGGSAPDGQTFTMSVFTLPSGVGYGALFFSLTFGFLSFAGFEGASTMGEETANPTKAIPLAILGCVVFAGLFYVVVSVAESMGFGTNAAGVTAFTSSGNLMGDLAKSYVGSWVGRHHHPRRCFQRAQLVPGKRHRRLAAAVCLLARRRIRRHRSATPPHARAPPPRR